MLPVTAFVVDTTTKTLLLVRASQVWHKGIQGSTKPFQPLFGDCQSNSKQAKLFCQKTFLSHSIFSAYVNMISGNSTGNSLKDVLSIGNNSLTLFNSLLK